MKSATYLLPGDFRLRVLGPERDPEPGAEPCWRVSIDRPGSTASVGAARAVGSPGAGVLEDLQDALVQHGFHDDAPVELPRGY